MHLTDEEIMNSKGYRAIDKGLWISYLGGILAGLSPFFYLQKMEVIGILCAISSLFVWNVARFFATNMLFGEEAKDG